MYVDASETGAPGEWYQYVHPGDPNHDKEGIWNKFTNSIHFVAEKMSYDKNIQQDSVGYSASISAVFFHLRWLPQHTMANQAGR